MRILNAFPELGGHKKLNAHFKNHGAINRALLLITFFLHAFYHKESISLDRHSPQKYQGAELFTACLPLKFHAEATNYGTI